MLVETYTQIIFRIIICDTNDLHDEHDYMIKGLNAEEIIACFSRFDR